MLARFEAVAGIIGGVKTDTCKSLLRRETRVTLLSGVPSWKGPGVCGLTARYASIADRGQIVSPVSLRRALCRNRRGLFYSGEALSSIPEDSASSLLQRRLLAISHHALYMLR